MWWTNHRTELATVLYARLNVPVGMSSILTAEPPVRASLPSVPSRSSSPKLLAAARSASLSAAHTHSTFSWLATDDRPETTPPPPRRTASCPSSPRENETGPRLDATSTRRPVGTSQPPLASPIRPRLTSGRRRAEHRGSARVHCARNVPTCPRRLECGCATTSYCSSRGVEGTAL